MTAEAAGALHTPGVDEVRRIVDLRNPVLRNLEITHCYSRLSAAVAARTGTGANWCTYATWASRQAGRTIRGEDLFAELGRRLRHGRDLLHPFESLWRSLLRRGLFDPESRLGRLTAELHTPFDAFERSSDSVARGNLKVFEEIGLEFARYLHECPAEAAPDSTELLRFLDGLRPGDPPDGQGYLRRAFERYQRQRFESDRKTRAELIVLANLEIGFHEQTRLQPQIREALDAAFVTQEDLGRRLLVALVPSAARWRAGLGRPAAALLEAIGSRLQRTAAALARETITQSFLVLSLPGRVLALGVHLDDPFPEALRDPRNPDLVELLGRFEPVPPEPDDCGARDWSELDQRMHYIVHLFRAFHAQEAMLGPAFTAEQVASIERGIVPGGAL